jgi:glycosyltransferase involved in cell wall biosynthesis
VVEHDRTGLLVPAGAVTAIGDAIVRLATEPETRARMSAEARTSVADRYGIPRLVGDVDALYRRLLAAPARSRRK